MKENYHKTLEKICKEQTKSDKMKTLLLHVCCAPCATHVVDYLAPYFDLTLYFYNPNLMTKSEYEKRLDALYKFVQLYQIDNWDEEKGAFKYNIKIMEEPYEPEVFMNTAMAYKDEPEGGTRCTFCFNLRLGKTAEIAKKNHFDYFGTSLTISPMKDAGKINEIGLALGEKQGVAFLVSDFKKKEGYKKSIEWSKKYDLYRQHFCGCVFSLEEE